MVSEYQFLGHLLEGGVKDMEGMDGEGEGEWEEGDGNGEVEGEENGDQKGEGKRLKNRYWQRLGDKSLPAEIFYSNGHHRRRLPRWRGSFGLYEDRAELQSLGEGLWHKTR